MQTETYQQQAERTVADRDTVIERITEQPYLLFLIMTEISFMAKNGDYIDRMKKSIFYGKKVFPNIDVTLLEVTQNRVKSKATIDLLHAAMGMITEAIEFAVAIRSYITGETYLDTTNLIEELGDSQWYHALAANTLGVSFEEIQQINIAKLRTRYPEKFTEEAAENRDLIKEREILEDL